MEQKNRELEIDHGVEEITPIEEETEDDDEIIVEVPPDIFEQEKTLPIIQKKQEEIPDSSLPKKPIEGETNREFGLRKENERLRERLREKNKKEIIENIAEPPETVSSSTNERLEKLKESYTEDELRVMEEAIDVLAEQKGYVKKEHTYASAVNNFLDEFLNEHAEYKAENDINDVRWGLFNQIIKSDYNLSSKTPSQIKNIFVKVHRDVSEELGVSEIPTKESQKNNLNAQTQKIKSVSHSGGTVSSSQGKPKSNVPTNFVSGGVQFKGFSEDDF